MSYAVPKSAFHRTSGSRDGTFSLSLSPHEFRCLRSRGKQPRFIAGHKRPLQRGQVLPELRADTGHQTFRDPPAQAGLGLEHANDVRHCRHQFLLPACRISAGTLASRGKAQGVPTTLAEFPDDHLGVADLRFTRFIHLPLAQHTRTLRHIHHHRSHRGTTRAPGHHSHTACARRHRRGLLEIAPGPTPEALGSDNHSSHCTAGVGNQPLHLNSLVGLPQLQLESRKGPHRSQGNRNVRQVNRLFPIGPSRRGLVGGGIPLRHRRPRSGVSVGCARPRQRGTRPTGRHRDDLTRGARRPHGRRHSHRGHRRERLHHPR
mmetsp:Transcript_2371/g.5370  ORF Transcript_2371/g.5370 Transcript_2371/m.5370 type:complete len:318 (-) Transcript_2371:1814-2767(-)